MPILTLTTDFGWDSGYVAQMKAVLLGALPAATLVDVAHDLPPGSVRHAEVLLRQVAFSFPLGTTHLVVVDPEVGTSRRALAVRARGHLFVGPDNGVLGLACAQPDAEVVVLDRPAFWRSPVSATFHGRDVFAPVAAELAGGLTLADVGVTIDDANRSTLPQCRRAGDEMWGVTLVADRFGNLCTNLPARLCETTGPWSVRAGDATLTGVRTYGDAPKGALVALVGSDGFIEIAVNQGAATERLGVDVPVVARARRDV